MTPEQFAGWMDEKGYKPNGENFEDLLKTLENQIARNYVKGMVKAAKIEREECAKVCESIGKQAANWPDGELKCEGASSKAARRAVSLVSDQYAAAIRERGKL